MEAIGNSKFRSWASRLGIGFDERYPDVQSLAYIPDHHLSRFWTLPDYQGNWPHLASCLLMGIDPWDAIVLWPRTGRWPLAPDKSDWNDVARDIVTLNDVVRDIISRGAGVPGGWVGAARFRRQEMGAVIAIMFAHMSFGWCVDDDLYLVPDHGQQYLQVNHHDVVHVEFRDEARLRGFVAQMEAKGYPLPTDVPDGTFKRPSWMLEEDA